MQQTAPDLISSPLRSREGQAPEHNFHLRSKFHGPRNLELVTWNFLGNCGLELVLLTAMPLSLRVSTLVSGGAYVWLQDTPISEVAPFFPIETDDSRIPLA